MDDRSDRRVPPEDAPCAEHEGRMALATCPRCGRHVCLECWHQVVDRCHRCLSADPSGAAGPIPWEDEGRGAVARYFATLASALHPVRTAPAFGRPEIGPAIRFALYTMLPLTLLSGVLPYTHRLGFGDRFGVESIGSPSNGDIARDVVNAMGVSLLIGAVSWLALVLPLASLARAYGGRFGAAAAVRVLLYRGFLLPLGNFWNRGLLGQLAGWGLDARWPFAAPVVQVLTLVPLVLLFLAMRSTARLAAGTSALSSYVTTLVSLVVLVLSYLLLHHLIEGWLPAPRDSG